MYTLNYNSPNQNADIHLIGFGWKRARKSFWTRWACWRVQCSHVCWHLGFECNTVETVGVVAAYAVVLCITLYWNLNSLSSGVSTANHLRWLVLLRCNVISPRVSTVNFAYWLVLVCCNLQSLSEFSAASLSLIRCNFVSLSSEVLFLFFHVLFRCKAACLSLAIWVSRLARSLTLSFLNLSLLWSAVSAAHWALSLSAPTPVFLLMAD